MIIPRERLLVLSPSLSNGGRNIASHTATAKLRTDYYCNTYISSER